MLRNHLKIAFRSLVKDRSSSLINLFGLTIGLTCCLIIGLYIWNELSFDQYHKNADRVYRVNRQFFSQDGSEHLHLGHVAPPFGPLLKNDFPDIEAVARLLQYEMTIQRGEIFFNEENSFMAEPAIFQIFDIPMLAGEPETALEQPFTAMMSESMATKYFGEENPLGQTFRAAGRVDVKVTGVFEDFPFNSHFHPDLLFSFATLNNENVYGAEGLRTNWGNNSFSTYLLLPEGYPLGKLEDQVPAFLDKHLATVYRNRQPSVATDLTFTPLTDIHLHSHLDSEMEENGDMRRVKVFSIIAILILFIACINYMNLATARSANRAKEIGVRKVVGARRGVIVGQFLSEAIMLSVLATILAIMLAQVTLPFINDFLGQELQVTPTMLGVLPLMMFGLALFTGMLAGLYPALYLSGMKPIRILKNTLPQNGKSGGVGLRKVLVVGQFVISASLIIATMVVYQQLNFMQTKDLGFDKDHIITLGFYSELVPQYESFRNSLLDSPNIQDIARSSRVPSGRLLDSQGSARELSQTDTLPRSGADLKSLRVDWNFLPAYGIELAAGRNFGQQYGRDSSSFILNEAGVANMGWSNAEEAVGKRILYGGQEGLVVGVVKDFNFESLHQRIQPMIFYMPSSNTSYNNLSIKVNGANLSATISELEKAWAQYLPQFPFDYQFVDERFGRLYESEQRQSRVFIGFAMVAILVACLGLFGLTAFVAKQRIKEIGIRKVLGASTVGIVRMLSKDFLKLVLFSLIIAAPVAYSFMEQWLQDFAFRINIEWWVFVVAGAVAIAIAFLTVSYQSVRAALANPVDSLRSE